MCLLGVGPLYRPFFREKKGRFKSEPNFDLQLHNLSALRSLIFSEGRRIMGQGTPGGLNRQLPGDRKNDDKKEKKFEPAAPPARVGRKQRKQKGSEAAARLPAVTPLTKKKRPKRIDPKSMIFGAHL
nr:26S proteasome regulatory subunit 4 homolog A [Ipomoea batatas]